MIYLSSFRLSAERVRDPNIYPYNLFSKREWDVFVFDRITVLYGNNASGKSTLLNIFANKLGIKGKESNVYNPRNPYFGQFVGECSCGLGEYEDGRRIRKIPENSRYIKSEDIMYEIKTVQQEQALQEAWFFDLAQQGYDRRQIEELKGSRKFRDKMEILHFNQEKYSNGETAMQIFDELLAPDALFLLDEPEVSLSPQNQKRLAEEINRMARFLNCQFIISTHSPFMLGTLSGKIYNIDSMYLEPCRWSELENVRFMYEFFRDRADEFLTFS